MREKSPWLRPPGDFSYSPSTLQAPTKHQPTVVTIKQPMNVVSQGRSDLIRLIDRYSVPDHTWSRGLFLGWEMLDNQIRLDLLKDAIDHT